MRSRNTVPFLVRGAIVALLAMIAAGLLFGPAGLRPGPRSAEAALLSEVKKLLASDAQEGDGQAGPTPVTTAVQPVVAIVVPVETIVTPVQSAAEASTEAAGDAPAQQSGDNLFTGIRGGLIGAGIGLGVVLVAAIIVNASRRVLRRSRP